jgi:dTDP-4-dehydrorhamnose reductase
MAASEAKLASLSGIPTSGYPTPAARPANSQLNCDKLAADFGVRLPDWETALALCLERNLPSLTR